MLICLPDVLDPAQTRAVRAILQRGDFGDGGGTAGRRGRRVKHNLQLPRLDPVSREAGEIVSAGLKASEVFRRAVLPKTLQVPLFSRYEAGMGYGAHVDGAISNGPEPIRNDVAVTLFLADPATYEGGELVVQTEFGDQEIKLPAGSAVAYPAASLHRVAPVTEGARLVAVLWVQSYIRDPAKREMLYDLDRACERLEALDPEGEATDLAYKTYYNLVRRWAEV